MNPPSYASNTCDATRERVYQLTGLVHDGGGGGVIVAACMTCKCDVIVCHIHTHTHTNKRRETPSVSGTASISQTWQHYTSHADRRYKTGWTTCSDAQSSIRRSHQLTIIHYLCRGGQSSTYSNYLNGVAVCPANVCRFEMCWIQIQSFIRRTTDQLNPIQIKAQNIVHHDWIDLVCSADCTSELL